MDAMGSALKNKMKMKSSPTPVPDIKDEEEKQELDMAPDTKPMAMNNGGDGGDAEISRLKSMGAGTPIGRNPMGLAERAKGKMNERMASIMKEKKSGKY